MGRWGFGTTVAGELVEPAVNLVEFGIEPPGAGNDQGGGAQVGQANGGAKQDDAAET